MTAIDRQIMARIRQGNGLDNDGSSPLRRLPRFVRLTEE
jgi:hypothetical protein